MLLPLNLPTSKINQHWQNTALPLLCTGIRELNFLPYLDFYTINLCMQVLPLISSSAQCDFFPFAASSEDMIVYILLGSGGSYFSLGMPVELKKSNQYSEEPNNENNDIFLNVSTPVLWSLNTTSQQKELGTFGEMEDFRSRIKKIQNRAGC